MRHYSFKSTSGRVTLNEESSNNGLNIFSVVRIRRLDKRCFLGLLRYSYPSRHLVIQNQKWKHQNNIRLFNLTINKPKCQQGYWFYFRYCEFHIAFIFHWFIGTFIFIPLLFSISLPICSQSTLSLPLRTSENRNRKHKSVCFQGIEKRCPGNKWVNSIITTNLLFFIMVAAVLILYELNPF